MLPPRERGQRDAIQALKRVMPRVDPEPRPEPTLMETLCQGFQEGWGGETDVSTLLDDGKAKD